VDEVEETPAAPRKSAEVIDLVALLKKSLEGGKAGSKATSKTGRARKRA
jgi:non-homologous end joining protein Ku